MTMLDLGDVLQVYGDDGVDNAFSAGYLRFVTSDADTLLQLDTVAA